MRFEGWYAFKVSLVIGVLVGHGRAFQDSDSRTRLITSRKSRKTIKILDFWEILKYNEKCGMRLGKNVRIE